MRLTWFGHSAYRIEIGGSIIMIDPFLQNPTFTGDIKAAYAGATHVFLTHGHEDHLGSTAEICAATGALLVANHEICGYLAGQGITNSRGGNHGGEIDLGDFSVAFVPALHSSSVTIDGKPIYLGNPLGLVLRAPGEKTLLHMGDTGISAEMALTQELYEPRIGIVPIGDMFTMGPNQAALACRRFFRFETVLPCHFGTFPGLEPNADRFVAALEGSGTRVLVPEPGMPVAL